MPYHDAASKVDLQQRENAQEQVVAGVSAALIREGVDSGLVIRPHNKYTPGCLPRCVLHQLQNHHCLTVTNGRVVTCSS